MRFHLFTLLLLSPLSLTAPTSTSSLAVRDPLPAPPSALLPRQAATPEVDLTATLDKLSGFLKTLFDNIDFSTLQKRQDTDAIVDALNEFIKEAVASLGAALQGNQKRQAQAGGVDLTATLDKLAEFLKKLFQEVDFQKIQEVQKRQAQGTDAIIDALNEFIKEALATLGTALSGAGKVKRQAQAGGVDLTETFDKLAEFLKKLFEEVDFNKVGEVNKRQAQGTDAIIDALNEFIKEALATLGAALSGAGNVKRQAQAGGVDLTETFDKLAEFLKQLFQNISL